MLRLLLCMGMCLMLEMLVKMWFLVCISFIRLFLLIWLFISSVVMMFFVFRCEMLVRIVVVWWMLVLF